MAYNSPDNLASDCIFHHFVPSPPWVTLIISCPTYSCLRTFELAIPSAWKWLRWLRICLQGGKPRFDPWVRRIPWRREWLPIPVFVPGEFHGQMSMVGYSPQSGKEWVTTEANNTFPFTALRINFEKENRSIYLQGPTATASVHHPKCFNSVQGIIWVSDTHSYSILCQAHVPVQDNLPQIRFLYNLLLFSFLGIICIERQTRYVFPAMTLIRASS